uniref:Pol polyprotein putative n=1 Tax=Albugo laibachii Nc14 TaxID=890382 RepID=F0WCE0_9STRA|nr:pol polyprotein putative [Albugo laibachii Nc14]|eukprot:CCA18855.1 pol polyprotein putative [Albugo laibachii Nc14]
MSALEIKDLGVMNKLVGLRISLDEEVGYVLDQEVSIDLLLKGYGLETANGVRAPIAEDFNDCNSQEPEYLPVTAANGNASVKNFQSLVGRATRQTHKPTMDDWKMAKRISRYLKETKMLKLQIGGVGVSSGDVKIDSWSEADFTADKSDQTDWGVTEHNGGRIHCGFTRGSELLGLRQLFQELGIKIAEPMKMKMDNQAAIKQLESEKSTASAKHVEIHFKFTCHYAHAQVVCQSS